MKYSFPEIFEIFKRCKTEKELSQACQAFTLIIEDGDMDKVTQKFTRFHSQVRFRQLIHNR